MITIAMEQCAESDLHNPARADASGRNFGIS